MYRKTPQTEARKAGNRQRILVAARRIVAAGGFGAAQVGAVAEAAGVATGTMYRYFPSQGELLAEVFREAAGREVAVMAEAAARPGPAPLRLAAGVRCFAGRALAGRRLAWALVAEPVSPAIEIERLVFRRAFAEILARVIAGGMADGAFAAQDPPLSAAFLVGAMAEALVGPLAPDAAALADGGREFIEAIVALSLRAVLQPGGRDVAGT